MVRNKYPKEFEYALRKRQDEYDLLEMLNYVRCFWGYDITADTLREYLSKRKIRYVGYNPKKAHPSNSLPIGSEYVKPDGMTLVKVEKDKWQYKQRKIYEDYYNVKLKDTDYIIFLDQDRTNFNIDNLMKISRRESSILSNQKMFSKNPDVTRLGITTAKLIVKVKEVEKNDKRKRIDKNKKNN